MSNSGCLDESFLHVTPFDEPDVLIIHLSNARPPHTLLLIYSQSVTSHVTFIFCATAVAQNMKVTWEVTDWEYISSKVWGGRALDKWIISTSGSSNGVTCKKLSSKHPELLIRIFSFYPQDNIIYLQLNVTVRFKLPDSLPFLSILAFIPQTDYEILVNGAT